MTVLGALLDFTAALLFLPVAVLFSEILCALGARKDASCSNIQRPNAVRIAVIIPAHDEEEGISATVISVARQTSQNDRVLVIADNCTDTTAERARAAGAEAIARFDLQRRGKGYALDFGIRHLVSDPPDIVVIVDADCRLGPRTIDALAARVHATGRAVQASNVMVLPSTADAKRRVSSFAWIVKNHVRPTGLAVLGLPCQLMGTGMAFPWEAIRRIDLATGNIVEDVKLGLDLAAAGCAPTYCPNARVESDSPLTERGYAVQRQRWEVGSLRTIIKIAPMMLLRGLQNLNFPLIAMAVDLCVPPLMMLLSSLLLGLIVSSLLMFAGGSILPVTIFGGSLVIFMLTLVLAWFRFGRDVLPFRDLLALPGVFVRKFGFYLSMWRGRGRGWARTDRK